MPSRHANVAYIVMAYTVMAHIVMAHIVMAHIVMVRTKASYPAGAQSWP